MEEIITEARKESLKAYIRTIPDFPKAGISFKDLTTLWKDPAAFKESMDILEARYKDKRIDKIVAAEARGFIIGSPLAYLIGAGFVPVRKPGKLPGAVISESYELEYGIDTLTIHKDAVSPSDRVLIIDDLIATGGTLIAIAKLIERLGAELVEICSLVELSFLDGRKKFLSAFPEKEVYTLLKF